MARGHSVRYRDPKNGRFVRNTGRRKLLLEGYIGNRRVLKDETPRTYRTPSAREIVKREHRKFESFGSQRVTGMTLQQALGKGKFLRKIAAQEKLIARVTLTMENARGELVKVRKEIKLAVRGKNRGAQNRAIIVKALLGATLLKGLRLSPKKFRTGSSRRTPTARNITLSIDAA